VGGVVVGVVLVRVGVRVGLGGLLRGELVDGYATEVVVQTTFYADIKKDVVHMRQV
jgi:hypothetical protein